MKILFLLFFLCIHFQLYSEQWYRSERSGLALRPISKAAALHEEYALRVVELDTLAAAVDLGITGDSSYRFEKHSLFENGEILFERSLVKDKSGTTRLMETAYSFGFYHLEWYDDGSLLRGEKRVSGSSSPVFIEYLYYDDRIIEMHRFIEEEGLRRMTARDRYYYNRSGSIRRIDRYVLEDSASELSEEEKEAVRFSFVPGVAFHVFEYQPPSDVRYTRDERGRLLAEQLYDDNGDLISETINSWKADRLQSVLYRTDSLELLTEYEYDEKGSRILEKNYRNDVLERRVYRDNDKEIEELFISGKAVLRAVWMNGQKISEERIGNIQDAAP